MISATVASILTAARRYADVETSTPTLDRDTDVELLEYLNDAYRELLDLIVSKGGQDLITKSVTLTSPYTLPSDFYRAVALERGVGTNRWVDLHRFNFRERNRTLSQDWPAWRVLGEIAGPVLRLFPSDATPGDLRLWYVPNAASIAAGDTISVFGGWNTYLSIRIAQRILAADERENSALDRELKIATGRVMTAAAELSLGAPEFIPDMHRVPAHYEADGFGCDEDPHL